MVAGTTFGGLWIGLHGPEEYLEFFATLDSAAGQGTALLASPPKCIAFGNEVQVLRDTDVGDTAVGHGFQILAMLLMQTGVWACGFECMIQELHENDGKYFRLSADSRERAAHKASFMACVTLPVSPAPGHSHFFAKMDGPFLRQLVSYPRV